jgi:hypothetical protein
MLYSFEEETDIAVEIKRHMRDSSTDEMDTTRYNTYVDVHTISESTESTSGEAKPFEQHFLKIRPQHKWTVGGLCIDHCTDSKNNELE